MGLSKIVSEDSLRHGLQAIPEAKGLRCFPRQSR
jgi:hypothetical protein